MLTSVANDRFVTMFSFLSELSREVFDEHVLRYFLGLIFRLVDQGIDPRFITMLFIGDLYIGLMDFPEEQPADDVNVEEDDEYDDEHDDEEFFIISDFMDLIPSHVTSGKIMTHININVLCQQTPYKMVCVYMGQGRLLPNAIWDAILETKPFNVPTLSDTCIDLGDLSLLPRQPYQWGLYHSDTPWEELRRLSQNGAFMDSFMRLINNKRFISIDDDHAMIRSISLKKCRATHHALDQAKNNADLLDEFFTT